MDQNIRLTKGSSSSAFPADFPLAGWSSEASLALSGPESLDVLIAFSAFPCFPAEATSTHLRVRL